MGLKPSVNATIQEVEVGTTLLVNGTLNVVGAMQNDGVSLALGVTLTPAAGTTNICDVTLQVTDGNGAALATVHNLDLWLSDAATGAGLTATTASGTVQAAAGSGTVIGTYTAKKALRVQTKADGTFVLEITDSAKTGFYVCVQIGGGRALVSTQLVTGNYG